MPVMKKIRNWRRRKRVIRRINWALVNLEFSYHGRPAGNHYIERLETLDARLVRATRKPNKGS